MVIGYDRSGATENISAYAVLGATAGNTVTFGTPMLIVQSPINNYFQDYGTGRNRWGDYSATWVDPDNPNVFWTVQEWARFHNFQADGFSGINNNEWVIQVAQITLPAAVPEPSTLALVSLAGLGLLWRRRRVRA